MVDLILASKSSIRKKMMYEANLPFEIIVSNADETPNENLSFGEQLKDISMRKAQIVFEKTLDRSKRIIVAADQNIVFDGVMYGKPHSIKDAKSLIENMEGRDNIFAYVGNAIIYADGNKILDVVNNYDVSRMEMDYISNEVLEDYLTNCSPLSKCGGISIVDASFIHLKEGRMSTASGMTIEYLQDMISRI